jgi:hypothetical protein
MLGVIRERITVRWAVALSRQIHAKVQISNVSMRTIYIVMP